MTHALTPIPLQRDSRARAGPRHSRTHAQIFWLPEATTQRHLRSQWLSHSHARMHRPPRARTLLFPPASIDSRRRPQQAAGVNLVVPFDTGGGGGAPSERDFKQLDRSYERARCIAPLQQLRDRSRPTFAACLSTTSIGRRERSFLALLGPQADRSIDVHVESDPACVIEIGLGPGRARR
jgi:hypothetical protein